MAHRSFSITTIHLGALACSLVTLWECFPDERSVVVLLGFTLGTEQLIRDSGFKLVAWAILGSVAAYYFMYLAYCLDQMLLAAQNVHDPRTRLLHLLHGSAQSLSVFGSLIFLIGRIEFGSRSWLLLIACSFGCGSIANYMVQPRSTAWTLNLFYNYSVISVGCSVGTVLGTLFLCFRLFYLRFFTPRNAGSEQNGERADWKWFEDKRG